MAPADKELESVFPFDAINAYFSGQVARTEMRLGDLDKIMELCFKDMFLLAINCASRAKQLFVPELDMVPLVPQLNASDPRVIHSLSKLLGHKAIDDIYCCRCTVEDQVVASLLIAQVYPHELYIGMVTFADPSKPIPTEKRKSVMQKYKGLGLLAEFVYRVEACAIARGCDNITLVANETSQMHLFQKYGFRVDDYPVARQKVAEGRLIPMHKAVPQ